MPSPPTPPLLHTRAEWTADTKVWWMINRSERLDLIDRSLANYAQYRTAYDAARQQTPLDMAATRDAFTNAKASFEQVGFAMNRWGPGHEQRDRRGAVSQLRDRLQQGQQMFNTGLGEAVPNTVHLAWVGGVPGAEVEKAIDNWKASDPTANVVLWTDRSNLLAGDYKRTTDKLRGNQTFTQQDDPAINERVRMFNRIVGEPLGQGLDQKLHMSSWPHLQQRREGELDQFIQRMGNRVEVRDVSELFQSQAQQVPGGLSPADRANLQRAYQVEIGARGNFAAGSDIVRLLAVHDRPGMYADIDITPPIKGLANLIDTYNQLQSQVRPQNRNYQPIDVAAGSVSLLNTPQYGLLMRAVEEHADALRTGIPSSGRAAQALFANIAPIDRNGRMQQAFNQWRNDTRHLSDVFEQVQPLNVEPELLKARQMSANGGPSSNSVLATSAAGAPPLTQIATAVVQNTQQATQPQNIRRYFDDTDSRNYRDQTIDTTGPNAMRASLPPAQFPRQQPEYTIPIAHFPHPSSSEIGHSWISPTPQQHPRHPSAPVGGSNPAQPPRHAHSTRSSSSTTPSLNSHHSQDSSTKKRRGPP